MCGALIICKKTESSRDDITELFPFLPHKRAKFGKRCVAERWLKNEKKKFKMEQSPTARQAAGCNEAQSEKPVIEEQVSGTHAISLKMFPVIFRYLHV